MVEGGGGVVDHPHTPPPSSSAPDCFPGLCRISCFLKHIFISVLVTLVKKDVSCVKDLRLNNVAVKALDIISISDRVVLC